MNIYNKLCHCRCIDYLANDKFGTDSPPAEAWTKG